MEKFQITKSQIIIAGPTCGKSFVSKEFPSLFIDQDSIMRTIDNSYFKQQAEIRARPKADQDIFNEKYDKLFVREALKYLREGKNLLCSRLNKDMLAKLFAFVPNGKASLFVWRDNPQEVFRLLKEENEDSSVTFQLVDQWYKDARSFQFADSKIFIKNGQFLKDVLNIPGAKVDVLTKEANTDRVKDIEESQRLAALENKEREDSDGTPEEN